MDANNSTLIIQAIINLYDHENEASRYHPRPSHQPDPDYQERTSKLN